MTPAELKHIIVAWLVPRHPKRVFSFLALLGILMVLWKMARQGPAYNYAVPCKARIADVSFISFYQNVLFHFVEVCCLAGLYY